MKRRRHDADFEFWNYEPKPAREVTGGLRARSKSGAFSKTWWGRRWIQVLEETDIGARLGRGRAYARKGQVADLRIEAGCVHATVQGSRRTPYVITIRLKKWTAIQITGICDTVNASPMLAARLSGNEMPDTIETVFGDLHLPLFPGPTRDLTTDCSCPDWSNPCKHIAAVHYLLAEALDNDPFILFELRGLGRDVLFAHLRGGEDADALQDANSGAMPLPDDPAAFWASFGNESAPLPAAAPTVHAALIKRLGPLPFWRSTIPFVEEMDRLCTAASEVAQACLADEEGE